MFRETPDNIQVTLNDRMLTAGKQALKAIDGSKAKMVGDYIYPNVDERKFAPLFSEKYSCPNLSIRMYVSALVLKRIYMMSDEFMLENLRCGALNLQYTLHTTQEKTQPLSQSSLTRFRSALEAYNKEHKCDLVKDECRRISKKMAIDMGVLHEDPNSGDGVAEAAIVRMDSIEVECHARAMGRIEIMYVAILIVLRLLLKKDLGQAIPASLGHYMEKDDRNRVLYHRHRHEKQEGLKDTRLEETVSDMLTLRDAMEQNFSPAVLGGMDEYSVFLRVLDEQTKPDGHGGIVPKSGDEISPDSVQNPFDTTATYRFKHGKHHGYVFNVAEAIDGRGNGVIIDASLEPNTMSDSSMAEEYVGGLPEGGPGQTVIADGAYSSDRLEDIAAQKGVKIQTTSLTGAQPYDIDADFELSNDGKSLESCPCGHSPVYCKYSEKTGVITARMPAGCCADCPHREECNVKINEKSGDSTVKITDKMVRRARQARGFSTEEGKLNARMRNGVEGIMSVMRRKYRLDQLPVFGIVRSRIWVWTSVLAYNLTKYAKFLKGKTAAVVAA